MEGTNFDGSTMRKGVHYEQLYAPVMSWGSIRLALAIATANNWVSTQVDYVLAFPQAPVECPIYMDIPHGDRIPSTTPGAEPPRDTKDSGSARSHSTHLETSSSNRP